MVKSELGFAIFFTEKMGFDALQMEFDHETWTLEMRFWASYVGWMLKFGLIDSL